MLEIVNKDKSSPHAAPKFVRTLEAVDSIRCVEKRMMAEY